MNARIVLTAAEMRRAEEEAIAAGTPVERLMERAGQAAAAAIRAVFDPNPCLVLCGPGNNGGDGYVVARELARQGWNVRVAHSAAPASDAARAARESWDGPVEALADAKSAFILVDALFGTGLRRPLEPALADRLGALASAARHRVAIDLPSGASSDDGRLLSAVPDFDLTITFQTLKPSHLLQPAARHMGRIVVADIGIAAESRLHQISPPDRREPGPDDHKYKRGYVAVIAGDMPGAAGLAAAAAARGGAGYVRLVAEQLLPGLPLAVIQDPGRPFEPDPRIGALVVGPGLGRGEQARIRLRSALESGLPLVLDADALHLLAEEGVERIGAPAILTPHQGEFARLFGKSEGSKVEVTRRAASESGAVILHKGADTIVAASDGRAAIAPPAPHWLASAGTGDVLSGLVGARLALAGDPFEAACDAAWLHGRAASLAGPVLVADDLLSSLPAALALLR